MQYARMILMGALFVMILPGVLSWSGYTHEWICQRAGLSHLDCRAADDTSVQKQYQGLGFVNHHCTLNGTDCSARRQAIKFEGMNTTDTDGFAAHLYADSMVPVHWYSTDYDDCHGIFEDAVEENLRANEYAQYVLFGDIIYSSGDWEFSLSCTTKDGEDITLFASDEYMQSVAEYVALQMDSEPLDIEIKTYDLTPIAIVLIALFVIMAILFFIFGMKNRG